MDEKTIYYIVELINKLEGFSEGILCSDKDISNFINSYDKDKYKLISVNGVGALNLDYKDFIVKKEDN